MPERLKSVHLLLCEIDALEDVFFPRLLAQWMMKYAPSGASHLVLLDHAGASPLLLEDRARALASGLLEAGVNALALPAYGRGLFGYADSGSVRLGKVEWLETILVHGGVPVVSPVLRQASAYRTPDVADFIRAMRERWPLRGYRVPARDASTPEGTRRGGLELETLALFLPG